MLLASVDVVCCGCLLLCVNDVVIADVVVCCCFICLLLLFAVDVVVWSRCSNLWLFIVVVGDCSCGCWLLLISFVVGCCWCRSLLLCYCLMLLLFACVVLALRVLVAVVDCCFVPRLLLWSLLYVVVGCCRWCCYMLLLVVVVVRCFWCCWLWVGVRRCGASLIGVVCRCCFL